MNQKTDSQKTLDLPIFAISIIILFMEMVLIRWISTEIRIFAYLQNSILIAAFLGLGLGCYRSAKPVKLFPALLCLFFITFFIHDPFRWYLAEGITQGVAAFQNSVVWYESMPYIKYFPYIRIPLIGFSLAISFIILTCVALTFFPFGQRLGLWISQHPRAIRAYTFNIFGSLIGIAVFEILSLIYTSPWLWLLLLALSLILFVFFTDERGAIRWVTVLMAMMIPFVSWMAREPQTRWSPYQKLTLIDLNNPANPDGAGLVCGKMIKVNNVGYQSLIDLDRGHMATAPKIYPKDEIRLSHYVLPYELIGQRERILIVGAGAGNDVSGALQSGAKSIEAVEIDPLIIKWGQQYHPNLPYDSPRVNVTINDARAFFGQHDKKYDLIWFGLLDAHTSPSAFANVRLDHFVYTTESFDDMKELLTPKGVVILFFGINSRDPKKWWIADRLAKLLKSAFGSMPLGIDVKSETPCLGWGGLLMIGGSADTLRNIQSRALSDPVIKKKLIMPHMWPDKTTLTTDDWPYLYLQRPSIPKFHLLIGILCLILGLRFRKQLLAHHSRLHGTMFFLGAGFMLLEISAVNRASLLFGTTWKVNAIVVGTVMIMILLANLFASKIKINAGTWPFAGLILNLLVLILLPISWFAGISLPLRVIVGGSFLVMPVFFSGLLFISLWAKMEHKDQAFGSNLLGSLVGGVASMLSMQIGFKALMWLTLAVYLIVFLLIRKETSISSVST